MDRRWLRVNAKHFSREARCLIVDARKSFSEILRGRGDDLSRAWEETEAAQDFRLLPKGGYVCRVERGELSQNRNGTPSYKLTFRVLEGEHKSHLVWRDLWLTEHALPMTKRDLAKLGITSLAQLELPLPRGMRASVMITLHRDDSGKECNRVTKFDVIGVDLPDDDPFAPTPSVIPSATGPDDEADSETLDSERAEQNPHEPDWMGPTDDFH